LTEQHRVEAASRRVQTPGPGGEAPPLQAEIGYFDPAQPIGYLSGSLPHWRQEGVTYFVTFRLGDSVPQAKIELWRREHEAWLKIHPAPHTLHLHRDYHLRFVERFEKWLDAGYGSCVLASAAHRQVVVDALQHFNRHRYVLGEWVVMPNHVHVIVTPLAGHDVSSILKSWKSFTGHELNRRLGRQGPFWQTESFDHIVRNPESLERIIQYIQANPGHLAPNSFSRSEATL